MAAAKKSAVPSAWDDDWENLADKEDAAAPAEFPAVEPKLSRAERKLRHQEANRQLWESASSTPETPIFIQARSPNPPLIQTPIRPAVKVLARKPPPKSQPTIISPNVAQGSKPEHVEDEPDSEEEERIRAAAEFADRQARATKEREEKQKKYAETRARIFGSEAGNASPNSHSRSGSAGRSGSNSRPPSSNSGNTRGNGRGRGNARGGSTVKNVKDNSKLFDPEYSPKPGSVFIQRRDAETSDNTTSRGTEEKPVRQPQGPNGNTRGFGFAGRGRGRGV